VRAGHGLGDTTAVAVSPDGRNVYVVSKGTQALAAFSRDAGSGALTELGCFTLWVNHQG
jgi:6-phosphogluconolactonase (cycloisomerase 2 family)